MAAAPEFCCKYQAWSLEGVSNLPFEVLNLATRGSGDSKVLRLSSEFKFALEMFYQMPDYSKQAKRFRAQNVRLS